MSCAIATAIKEIFATLIAYEVATTELVALGNTALKTDLHRVSSQDLLLMNTALTRMNEVLGEQIERLYKQYLALSTTALIDPVHARTHLEDIAFCRDQVDVAIRTYQEELAPLGRSVTLKIRDVGMLRLAGSAALNLAPRTYQKEKMPWRKKEKMS